MMKPASLIATFFGSGLLPKAPGTWGSLLALPFGIALLWAGGPWLLAAGILVVSLAGWWASAEHARLIGRDDPGEIVIDEVAGQWIALLPAALAWPDVAIAFLLFRVADIFKPWPASWADRQLHGGLGIMADDLVAGAYAALGLYLLKLGGFW